MDLEVVWLNFAERKLKNIYDYHKLKAGRKIAVKLIEEIIDTTIILANQPEIGPIEELLLERKEEFRYLVFKNYKIIYFINSTHNRIEIANVFDTRQNPLKLQQENNNLS